MLLTEDEAKTKECRAIAPARDCAASRCMHWRFGEPEYEHSDGKLVDVEYVDGCASARSQEVVAPDGEGWWRVMPLSTNGGQTGWRRVKAKRGFCGLAGLP